MPRVMNALLLALLCDGCDVGWVEPTIAQPAPPVAVATLAQPIAPVPVTMVGSTHPTLPLRPAVYIAPDPCGVPDEAIELIVSFEVGSPERYTAKYQRPIWPGLHSGVTVGVGYDLGYRKPEIIAIDWEAHPHHTRLVTAAGITGVIARDHARRLADVSVAWGLAREVFDQTLVIEYLRIARRAFGDRAFCAASPRVRGALLSLVFNRGGSMAGEGRREMRHIRDVCLAATRDAGHCVANQLRAMVRIWRGKDIERGMANRRGAEAAMAERAA